MVTCYFDHVGMELCVWVCVSRDTYDGGPRNTYAFVPVHMAKREIWIVCNLWHNENIVDR